MRIAWALTCLLWGGTAWGEEGGRAALFASSYALEAKGDIPGAIQALGAAETGDYLAQLRLGWLHYRNEEWNASAGFYRKATQTAPEAVEPLLGLMLPLQAAGRVEEALAAGYAVLKLDPSNYTALSRMAWMQYARKEYAQAAGLYRRLVQRYPSDTEMLLGLGWSLKLAGKSEEAAECFRQALILSPASPRALAGLKES